MELDIQKFSGGSYDYKYYVVDDYYNGKMFDAELNDLINDLVKIMHDVEWWQSGDTLEEDYRESVKKFKNKWFGQTRSKRLKTIIDNELENKRKELYDLIGIDEVDDAK